MTCSRRAIGQNELSRASNNRVLTSLPATFNSPLTLLEAYRAFYVALMPLVLSNRVPVRWLIDPCSLQELSLLRGWSCLFSASTAAARQVVPPSNAEVEQTPQSQSSLLDRLDHRLEPHHRPQHLVAELRKLLMSCDQSLSLISPI